VTQDQGQNSLTNAAEAYEQDPAGELYVHLVFVIVTHDARLCTPVARKVRALGGRVSIRTDGGPLFAEETPVGARLVAYDSRQ
jgi:hypothetical protein